MRPVPNLRLERYRVNHTPLGSSPPGANWGVFRYKNLGIISSGEDEKHGWEHVSVSCRDRTPTWEEMQSVKELFWTDEETVMQFHPPKDKYINHHPHVLHMWRKLGVNHELPPPETIA